MRHLALALLLVAAIGAVPGGAAASAAATTPVQVPVPAPVSVPAVVSASATASSSSGAPAPLVVLLDISGSMDDTVPASSGNGTVVKLDAAKKAIEEPISNQPPGSSVGIWTFPGGKEDSQGCSPGGWLMDVNSGDSVTTILQKINGLGADGDTPTGPALTDVVNSLKSRGITNANILVVSDGLDNCGPDPCDVAKGLAGTGFTLSIQAVGFDISDSGAEDLQCMANATGGNYFDVSNGAQLDQVITQLSRPQFALKLTAPAHPIAGQTTKITATVTNTSALDAHTAELRLAFSNAQTSLLTPQVIPSTIGLGTLPAGKAATRTWTFVVPNVGAHRSANYSVSASSFESLPVQASGSFSTIVPGLEAADSGPVLSNLVKTKEPLAILGDSYSSGEGAHKYLPASAGVAAKCHRSPDTYLVPEFTIAKVNVDILACSGATTDNLVGPQIDGSNGSVEASPQLLQLNNLSTAPGAVVMTIGGNDIDFKGIVSACVAPDTPSCAGQQPWVDNVLARPGMITDRLVQAYKNTWLVLNQPKFLAQRGGKYAPVIVLAYPDVVHATQAGACPVGIGPGNVASAIGTLKDPGFDASETKLANNLETALNNAIGSAVAQTRAEGFEVYYSDRTAGAFLPDHTICESASKRWVNEILGTVSELTANNPESESFHPTAAGYSAEGDEVIEWSKTLTVVPPTAAATKLAADPGGLSTVFNSVSPPSPKILKFDTTVQPGQGVLINENTLGVKPVTVTMHSEPRLLGALTPDAHGTVHGYVSIPSDISYGPHQVILEGWDKEGNPIIRSLNITVRPATPTWVLAVGLSAVWLLAVALVLAVIFRRRLWGARPQIVAR